MEGGVDAKLAVKTVLVDIRSEVESAHVHLPGAVRLDPDELRAQADRMLRGRGVIIACAVGQRSLRCVQALRDAGVEAWSLCGGIAEWSALDLPRVRPEACAMRHGVGNAR